MKYKVGDKIRITRNPDWDENVLTDYDKLSNGVATIKTVYEGYYRMEEIGYGWRFSEIKGLVEENMLFTPIESRFELLDFD